ncbi:MAG TPA: DUF294 nucleotidyltransferase-like domain-containing protein [Salinarimonas sp.]|nr:DUF294 nucleotidyltransferase-like domain-containing protein [Salinarimonas sp.]
MTERKHAAQAAGTLPCGSTPRHDAAVLQPSPAAALTRPVASAAALPPRLLPPGAPLREAVATMEREGVAAILVAGADRRPLGILTEADIARRVAFRLPPEAPVSAAMTAPVATCAAGEGLWRAVALMRTRGFRFLPVVDEAGACTGMLSIVEAMTAASGNLLAHLDALAGDEVAVKRAQAGLAATLLAEGLPAAEVVGLVSEINLDLHRLVLERVLAGHGPPPVPFTLLVMGSAGRGESLLRPDQDNGFILGDHADADAGAVDSWFIPFAEAYNAALDATGFPLCKGGVMGRNPLWRKTLPQWRAQFGYWARRRVGAALLFSDIAFDFRAAWGDAAPAVALRRHLHGVLEATPALLVALAQQNAQLSVGLTFWGGFADDEAGPGTRTDLKLHGLMPLVAAARLLALRQGVFEVSTPGRIAGIAATGALTAGEAERLTNAFVTLLDAVLRQQLADHAAGETPGNLVDTAALPKPERARLREALRAVRGFANTTWAGFTGRIF